jgi:hypothetical protein
MSTGTLLISDVASWCLRRRIDWKSIAGISAALLLFLTLSSPTNAQEHWPAGSVGKLQGEDISVEGGAYPVSVQGATTLFVSSGSVVTVHSGAARLTLSAGGMVDICGPAKFTLLESGGSFTVALSFGRVRLRLNDPTPVRIYTPFIIATPVAIANDARDFTLGLDVNDLMCIYAGQGAAGIEQQFGGENLIVPELGEFFLSGERLPPVAGKAGSCRCDSYQPPAAATTRQSAPPEQAKAPEAAPTPESVLDADKGFDLPANANQTPPVAPTANAATTEPPAVETPVWKVIMPSLSFSASLPAPPADSGPQAALAIPDYSVSRDWVFNGHVEDATPRADKKSRDSATAGSAGARQKRKGGFWGKLKRFFGGEPAPPPEQPAGSADSGN